MPLSQTTGLNLRALCAAGMSAALLTACASDDIARLDESKMSGDAYTDRLATNYLDYAKFENNDMYDAVDAAYFAQKGQKALRSGTIPPERPEKWNIADKAMMNDLQRERTRLMAALNKGAAEKMPGPAARALVSYDCWVEQAEEGWQTSHIEGCRTHFENAMAVIDDGMVEPVADVTAEKDTTAAPVPAPAPAVQQYLVFFDWDSARLNDTARDIVRTAARNAREAGIASIVVVGHADRSGPRDYNNRLSVRRAEAVADVLEGMGYSDENIRIAGRGERDSLVPTADGIREPQNRRVRITISDQALGA